MGAVTSVAPFTAKWTMTPRLRERLEAAAESRHMTVDAFVHQILKDFLSEQDARAGGRHEHCPCRNVTPDGWGTCCLCGERR